MARRGARGDARVDGALLALALVLGVGALALPDARADATAGTLRRTVFAPLVALQVRAERARRALAAHDSTALARDSIAMRALGADQMAHENERLRGLLGLGARLGTGFVAAEAVHSRALGEEHILVLSAGRSAGVTPFSPVITADGIVGYVRSADAASSVAIVWPHPDLRVSGVTVDGSASGIVSAHLGDGASTGLLELRGVPFRVALAEGTRIVSSGLGGTFPRGVPIGTVLQQLDASEGWERTYLVLPAVRVADAGAVMVLIADRAHADLTTLWRTDSATTGAPPAASATPAPRRVP